MKKILLFIFIAGSFFLTGCEITREITLNKDNSGTLVTTTDMSSLIGMIKMSGQGKDLEKLGDEGIDTTFSLDKLADSLRDISAEEKEIIRKAKFGMLMNMSEDKMVVKLEFPFSDPGQIINLEKLSSKLMIQTMKEQLAEAGDNSISDMPGMDKMESSIDDYFITSYSNNVIEKKLNKEKYANVESDEAMKGLKEMSGMGLGNNTLIINLPQPAKKAEGKNLTLSDDKKKVTITSNLEDFFDDATSLEFRIEY